MKDGRHGARRLKLRSKLVDDSPLKGYDTWSASELEHMNERALAALHKGLPGASLKLRMRRIALENEYYRRHGYDYFR